jgi:hypothetical protein
MFLVDETIRSCCYLLEFGLAGVAFGLPNILLIQSQPAVVCVTEAPDDRDPEFVIANGGRAGPAAALPKLVAGHLGSIEPGADLLAAGANGAFANAPAITASGAL